MRWRLVTSQLVVDDRWYRLRRDTVELPNGAVLDDYYVAVRPDVAVVVAVTPDDDVLLARQYKHGIGEITLELPGGSIEDDESPQLAAARELGEEVGYACSTLEPLGALLHAPSNATNKVYGFLGQDARGVTEPKLDPSEEIALVKVPRPEVLNLIGSGHIAAADSVAFLLLAMHRLAGRL